MKTKKPTMRPGSDDRKDHAKQRFYDKRKLLLEAIPLLIFIMMLITAIIMYPRVPDTIPTHWNASGEADGFGGRGSVFIIPIIFFIILVLFFILPLMEVFRENMLKIYDYYFAFKVIFSIFFAVLFITSLLPPLGYKVNVSMIVLGMVGVLFIAIGFIFPKLKRNFMFGIRTGWTLSSDRVWEKTHRLGGKLFVGLGILTIVMMFILPLEMMFFIFMGLTIAVSLFILFYSYYIYKKDA